MRKGWVRGSGCQRGWLVGIGRLIVCLCVIQRVDWDVGVGDLVLVQIWDSCGFVGSLVVVQVVVRRRVGCVRQIAEEVVDVVGHEQVHVHTDVC